MKMFGSTTIEDLRTSIIDVEGIDGWAILIEMNGKPISNHSFIIIKAQMQHLIVMVMHGKLT